MRTAYKELFQNLTRNKKNDKKQFDQWQRKKTNKYQRKAKHLNIHTYILFIYLHNYIDQIQIHTRTKYFTYIYIYIYTLQTHTDNSRAYP